MKKERGEIGPSSNDTGSSKRRGCRRIGIIDLSRTHEGKPESKNLDERVGSLLTELRSIRRGDNVVTKQGF